MVLSLNELCLRRVCNCMTDGILPIDLQTVSPCLRREIFSLLAKRNQLNDANCLRYMKQLLRNDDDLRTIDMVQRESRYWYLVKGHKSHPFLRFLNAQFRESLDLSHRITTLRLVTRGDAGKKSKSFIRLLSRGDGLPKDVLLSLRLIGRCRNLKHLTLVNESNLKSKSPHLLKALADAVRRSGSSGLESLELFRYCCRFYDFRPTSDQKLAFQRLKYLRIKECELSSNSWRRFLDCCRDSLECLVFDPFYINIDTVLPTRLEKLTTIRFTVSYGSLYLINAPEFYPNLKRVQLLSVRQRDLDPETISALRSLLPSMEYCSISLTVTMFICPLVIELIDIAGDRITVLDVFFQPDWSEDLVGRLLTGCSNLHTLKVSTFLSPLTSDHYEKSLKFLFSDRDRARKLVELSMEISVSEETLDLLFRNCVGLDVLETRDFGASISEQHIKSWIDGGARPSHVDLGSTQVADSALKLLISACGSTLKFLSNCDGDVTPRLNYLDDLR